MVEGFVRNSNSAFVWPRFSGCHTHDRLWVMFRLVLGHVQVTYRFSFSAEMSITDICRSLQIDFLVARIRRLGGY